MASSLREVILARFGVLLLPLPLLLLLLLLCASLSYCQGQPATTTTSLFEDTTDDAGVCPVQKSCCDDDCCGPNTVFQNGYCYFQENAIGWNGTFSENHEFGCVERSCCEDDCCRMKDDESTVVYYDPTLTVCVGIIPPKESITADFTQASESNILTKAYGFTSKPVEVKVLVSEDDPDISVFVVPGGGGGESGSSSCPPVGGEEVPFTGTTVTVPLNGEEDVTIFICSGGVVVGKCYHIFLQQEQVQQIPSYQLSVDFTAASAGNPLNIRIPFGPSFGQTGAGLAFLFGSYSSGGGGGGTGFFSFRGGDSTLSIGDPCPPVGATVLPAAYEDFPFTLFTLTTQDERIYACDGTIIAICDFIYVPSDSGGGAPVTAVPSVAPKVTGEPTTTMQTPTITPQDGVVLCESNNDCINEVTNACGYEFFDITSRMICCPSSATERIPNRQSGGRMYCTEQRAGNPCGTNTLCSSGVCFDGICLEDKRSNGERCDPNDHDDCSNGACGLEFYNTASDTVCCPSNETERIPNRQSGGKTYCTGQADGDLCGTNTQCRSGVCFEGVCMNKKRSNGERCDPNDNDDCMNGACGFEFYNTSSNMVCCPSNETQRIPNRQRDGKTYCTGQKLLAACGTNSQCESGICFEGTCVHQIPTTPPTRDPSPTTLASPQILRIVGTDVAAGGVDPYLRASTTMGETWGPVYSTSYSYVPYLSNAGACDDIASGWINASPDWISASTFSQFVVSARFDMPVQYTNAIMTMTMLADDQAEIRLNDNFLHTFSWPTCGSFTRSVTDLLIPGSSNFILMTLTDTGAILGYRFLIEITFDSAEAAVLHVAFE